MSRSKRKADDVDGALSGKVVLVTGGAQGLGLAVALMAAELGAVGIVIVDISEAKQKEVEAKFEATHTTCLYIVCNAAHPDQIKCSVARAHAHFGRIDGLVNCVGDTRRGTLEDTTVELWDAQMAVNLRAPFLFTQAVSDVMRNEGIRGSIVNIASVQSRGGLTFCMGYAAAKAGLICLTRNNATELAKHGIRVNAINMGWCVTDNEHALQLAESGDERWADKADQASLLGRIARPNDIAHAVVWLLDERTFTTGSIVDMHPEHIPGMLGGVIGKAAAVEE